MFAKLNKNGEPVYDVLQMCKIRLNIEEFLSQQEPDSEEEPEL